MQFDVKRLEREFVHDYHNGDRMYYVLRTSNIGIEKVVTSEHEEGWGPH